MRQIKDYQNENLLNAIKFTSVDVEQAVSDYPLEFDDVKNKKIEWDIKFTPFIMVFYRMVLREQRVPLQNDFIEEYLYINRNEHSVKSLSGEERRALKARLKRTYPSLVRDLHFALLLSENQQIDYVVYHPEPDVRYGIDLLTGYSGEHFAVHLFIKTKRSFTGRNKKKTRHPVLEKLYTVELPLPPGKNQSVSKIKLYSKRDAELLIEKMKVAVSE